MFKNIDILNNIKIRFVAVTILLAVSFFFIRHYRIFQPAAIVLAPNGGEMFEYGQAMQIRWTPGTPGIRLIEFVPVSGGSPIALYNAPFSYTVADTSGNRSFNLSERIPGGSYYVRIYTANSYEFDQSDGSIQIIEKEFSKTKAPPPSVSIPTPSTPTPSAPTPSMPSMQTPEAVVPQATPVPSDPIPATSEPQPVSLPTNVEWNASPAVKIEVTPTETAISAPQPRTSELPANCTQEGETITCPTSEAKQIVVPVITEDASSPLETVTIQKQAEGAIGITSQGVTAVTKEKVTVENNQLFIGSSGRAQPVNVLPDDAQDAAIISTGLTSVATTELKIEEHQAVYTVQGAYEAKLLFFIPVNIETTVKIDATDGNVISIQKPWWNFLTR